VQEPQESVNPNARSSFAGELARRRSAIVALFPAGGISSLSGDLIQPFILDPTAKKARYPFALAFCKRTPEVFKYCTRGPRLRISPNFIYFDLKLISTYLQLCHYIQTFITFANQVQIDPFKLH